MSLSSTTAVGAVLRAAAPLVEDRSPDDAADVLAAVPTGEDVGLPASLAAVAERIENTLRVGAGEAS